MEHEPRPEAPNERLLTHQHLAHGMILLDAEGRVVEWLGGAEKIFGWRPEEIRGEILERLFTPEDRERGVPGQEIAIAAATGQAPDDRWQVRKDGSRLWVEGVLSALRDPDGTVTGFAKVVRNRTESRGELELLENRVRELEEADRRKDAFLATLVHELRGPLTPLSNAMEIVESLAVSQPGLRFPLSIISRQIALLTRIVGDLSEMTRLGSGKLELTMEETDLNDAVRAAVESCLTQAVERHQALVALVPESPTRCPADPGRIQQVLVNLITNASKYTPPGGHIWVQLTIEGDEAVIRVRDDGIGIRPEMQSRIFELFTQALPARGMSEGGLGLGLPLVRELVELHGGNIQVHSEGENQGSEFVVKLPMTRR